jgi:predicted Holliday junction resolvase-like endonuclease
MNIRLILGILGGIVVVEFIAIIIQLRIYKREVDKSIEYENFRKDVLIKVAKERRELREALAKQQELKEKMAELSKKREDVRKTNGTE